MTVKKGLKDIKKYLDDEEAKFKNRGDGDSVKAKWFKIEDKQKVKVLFLQELDEDSENYSEKNGTGLLSVEHSNPNDFKRKAVCTADEDGCWACEQHSKDWKAGWKQKNRIYINVLVDNGTDEPFVAVLSQGVSDKSITPALLEYAEDANTVTDKWYTIKRNGSKFNDTSYLLMPSTASKENVEDYDIFDLDRLLYKVDYAQQEAHYLDGQEADVVASEAAAAAASSSGDSGDSEW